MIEQPNPLQEKFEWIGSAAMFLYLFWNAYLECVRPGDRSVAPKELDILRPDRMRVVPDPIHFVSVYEYTISERKVKFSSDQILHLKIFHTLMTGMVCLRYR